MAMLSARCVLLWSLLCYFYTVENVAASHLFKYFPHSKFYPDWFPSDIDIDYKNIDDPVIVDDEILAVSENTEHPKTEQTTFKDDISRFEDILKFSNKVSKTPELNEVIHFETETQSPTNYPLNNPDVLPCPFAKIYLKAITNLIQSIMDLMIATSEPSVNTKVSESSDVDYELSTSRKRNENDNSKRDTKLRVINQSVDVESNNINSPKSARKLLKREVFKRDLPPVTTESTSINTSDLTNSKSIEETNTSDLTNHVNTQETITSDLNSSKSSQDINTSGLINSIRTQETDVKMTTLPSTIDQHLTVVSIDTMVSSASKGNTSELKLISTTAKSISSLDLKSNGTNLPEQQKKNGMESSSHTLDNTKISTDLDSETSSQGTGSDSHVSVKSSPTSDQTISSKSSSHMKDSVTSPSTIQIKTKAPDNLVVNNNNTMLLDRMLKQGSENIESRMSNEQKNTKIVQRSTSDDNEGTGLNVSVFAIASTFLVVVILVVAGGAIANFIRNGHFQGRSGNQNAAQNQPAVA